MNIFSFFFSPTGGTLRALEAVASGMIGEMIRVDLCNPVPTDIAITDADVSIIAVPVYAGRIPAVVEERLEAYNGNGCKTILLAVYGNRDYDDALVELEDIAQRHGFISIAAIASIAEHSILREFGANRPDKEDKVVLKEFGRRIQEQLDNKAGLLSPLPGNRPYKERKPGTMFPQYDSSQCNKCGLCVRDCPVQAIDAENFETDKTHCISCMRCISACANKCRSIDLQLLNGLREHLKPLCSSRKDNELFW